MREPAVDAAMYARVFSTAEGALVLGDLARFYGAKLFYPESDRRTCFALGGNAVVDYIRAQIARANDPSAPADEPQQDDES